MFVEKENGTILWFNKTSFECGLNYELIGMMLGLCIYNSINLGLQFPLVVYKKLLSEPIYQEDLSQVESEIYKSFRHFKNYTKEDFQLLDLSFQIEYYDQFEERHVYNLVENGDQISVTQQNYQNYINLYVDWYMNLSIQSQFQSFKKGFFKVVTGEFVQTFNSEEIQQLICGISDIDFYEMQKYTRYEDGYTENSIQIKYFWEIIHELSKEQQRMFLAFVTGSDRAPINGLESLKFSISRHGQDNESLPTAHTCFNHFLLPPYSSKEKLKQKLLLAINNSEGFGLI